MKLWILFGDNIESSADLAYEVRRFISEGENFGVEVDVIDPARFDLQVAQDDRNSVLIDGKPAELPDFVFPYLDHHNRNYFSLAVIRQLERLGVPMFNNASTIEYVGDKLHTHQILAESSLPTPLTMLAKFPVDIDLVEQSIGFPLVVKTVMGHLGTGVFLVDNRNALSDLLRLVEETNSNVQLILQEFVKASHGRDLRLFVVDGEVIASMERRAKEGDFKANYSAGGSVHAFAPDETAQRLAIETAKVLNIQVAGIDLLFTEEGGYTICEANTFPGFKGLEAASGVNVPEAIFAAMKRALDAKRSHMVDLFSTNFSNTAV